MARLLITLSLGDLMLEEEKVMAITKHKSVLQMRKDYGVPQFDQAPHQSYAQHPTTIRAATSRAVHLYQEFNPSDVTGDLQPLPGTSIQTYDGLSTIVSQLPLTAQPDPDEARQDREAAGGAEGGEPKADEHGSAADRPPCQTQETTRHSDTLDH